MPARGSFWREIAFYAGVWTVLGLFSFTQQVVNLQAGREQVDWPRTLVSTMINFYTCGLGTPIYILLLRRLPLVGARVWRTTLILLLAMLGSVVLKYAVHVPLANALYHGGWTLGHALTHDFFGVFLDQIYIVMIMLAVEWYRAAREREMRAAELETQLSNARLDVLRSQLHPHFLFNTLNSISTLMHRDVDAADAMLARLSEMLRLTLHAERGQEVRLGNELTTLDLYLEIMRVRFGDRLTTQVDVAEALLDERVPTFLLQPLVENAIRHGIDESSSMTNIRVIGDADATTLTLRIVDDGRGLPKGAELREGIGLANTRRRLERLYGQSGSLRVADRLGGGTEVTVTIPRRVGLVSTSLPGG